jgi:hypothetical protein
MLPPFDLSVPSDDRYRPLAPEVATKYAELAGRPADAAQAFGADVGDASKRLGKPDQNIDLKLSSTDAAVTASVSAGGQSATLTSR